MCRSKTLQALAEWLTSAKIAELSRKSLAQSPHPFSRKDWAARSGTVAPRP
jgi:hypothetical protein